ncbi:hypothetical protein J2S05_001758 [Alkalicoccobacillus murimartini]|uniref:Uncharacterized protein n=1 Tax=Alkalicoccobacillus murimartini TaxID=171685 RepID=A0ABT9YGG7_9BACI|nr:hypothetical protein [Alkalicoccobacillus murimartini]
MPIILLYEVCGNCTVIYNEDENLWQISELIETNETDIEDL